MAETLETSSRARRQRWTGLTSLLICILGVGFSTYLTIEHYNTKPSYACPESARINCLKVTTSRWSHVGPVPLAVLGLAFFAGMAVLCLPYTWHRRGLDWIRVAGATTGVVVVLILVWIELFKVDAICLYCTAVHLCALALFGSVLWLTNRARAS